MTKWYRYGDIEYQIDFALGTITDREWTQPKKRKSHLRPANNFIPKNKGTQSERFLP